MNLEKQITVGELVLNTLEDVKTFIGDNPDNETMLLPQALVAGYTQDDVAELLRLAKQVSQSQGGAGSSNKTVKLAGTIISINHNEDAKLYNVLINTKVNAMDKLETLVKHSDVTSTKDTTYEHKNAEGETVWTSYKFSGVLSVQDNYNKSINVVVSEKDMNKMKLRKSEELIIVCELRTEGEAYNDAGDVYEQTQIVVDWRTSEVKRTDNSALRALMVAFDNELDLAEEIANGNERKLERMERVAERNYNDAVALLPKTAPKYQSFTKLGCYTA